MSNISSSSLEDCSENKAEESIPSNRETDCIETEISAGNSEERPHLAPDEMMRRRLQFFFMNPIQKFKAKRKFPYKLVVQVIKLVLVTMQLCLFAHSRYIHVNYTWDNKVAFSHLFLRGK